MSTGENSEYAKNEVNYRAGSPRPTDAIIQRFNGVGVTHLPCEFASNYSLRAGSIRDSPNGEQFASAIQTPAPLLRGLVLRVVGALSADVDG